MDFCQIDLGELAGKLNVLDEIFEKFLVDITHSNHGMGHAG